MIGRRDTFFILIWVGGGIQNFIFSPSYLGGGGGVYILVLEIKIHFRLS